MTASISPEHRRFFEEPNFGFLATVMPDGSPQVSAVWLDADDDTILVNTSIGRVKERNIRRDPRVALAVIDRNQPYSQVLIRGEVVEIAEEGAKEHIDSLAAKYTGASEYGGLEPGERRVTLRIRPSSISS